MGASERKRPWYLVLALLAALAFGANGARSGWDSIVLYRNPIDPSIAGEGISAEAERAAVVASVEAYVRTLDAAKPSGWPLAVATLLLGASTLFFAMRAMGGSGGARAALVQLVLAQAGVNAAHHWLLRDVDDAEWRWIEASRAAHGHEHVPDDVMRRGAASMALVHAIGSALVVVALTRRRSREFFDSTPAVVGGQ
jgi:hypothetical protein